MYSNIFQFAAFSLIRRPPLFVLVSLKKKNSVFVVILHFIRILFFSLSHFPFGECECNKPKLFMPLSEYNYIYDNEGAQRTQRICVKLFHIKRIWVNTIYRMLKIIEAP